MHWENHSLLGDSATRFLERKRGLRGRKPLSLRPKCNYWKSQLIIKSEAARTVSSDLLQRKNFSKHHTIKEDTVSPSQTCVKGVKEPLKVKDLLNNTTKLLTTQSLHILHPWKLQHEVDPGIKGRLTLTLWLSVPYLCDLLRTPVTFCLWADELSLRWLR